ASCVAVTQTPRPGSLHLRSGTASPSGPTTKRIMSATGLTVRVATHIRSSPLGFGPAFVPARGPFVSSMSGLGAGRVWGVAGRGGPFRLRVGVRLFGGGGRRRQIGLADPAGLEPRLHDDRLGLLAGDLDAVEDAGLALRLAVLAFGPAGEIVGGAAGQVFDRL